MARQSNFGVNCGQVVELRQRVFRKLPGQISGDFLGFGRISGQGQRQSRSVPWSLPCRKLQCRSCLLSRLSDIPEEAFSQSRKGLIGGRTLFLVGSLVSMQAGCTCGGAETTTSQREG